MVIVRVGKELYCTSHRSYFPLDKSCSMCLSEMKVDNSPDAIKVFKHDSNHEPNSLTATPVRDSEKVKVNLNKEVEQGVTITNKANPLKRYDSKLSTDVLTASIVSHAFRFVININPSLEWKNRRQICESKNLNVQLKAGIGTVYMTIFKGFKIWLADKSITIYFPDWKKYYVEEARFGFNYALEDLKVYLNDLSEFLNIDLSWNGIYRFKTSGQHHALIHNSLAKMYNRNKEKLNVYDKNGELWLVIDNSRRESIRMDDIETVGKKSDVNMDDVVDPFFNQLKDTGLMPNDILNMFKVVANIQKVSAEKEEFYAVNHESHVVAIRTLTLAVNELREQIKINKKLYFIERFR